VRETGAKTCIRSPYLKETIIMMNITEIKIKLHFKAKGSKSYSKYTNAFNVGDYIHNKHGELTYITGIRELPKSREFTVIGEHGMAETFKRNRSTLCTFK
jgi:hypothetical protein